MSIFVEIPEPDDMFTHYSSLVALIELQELKNSEV